PPAALRLRSAHLRAGGNYFCERRRQAVAHLPGAGVLEMKAALFSLTVVTLFLNACAGTKSAGVSAERTSNLGFGFRRIVLAEPANASFESIGHFEYFYYHNQRLCQI